MPGNEGASGLAGLPARWLRSPVDRIHLRIGITTKTSREPPNAAAKGPTITGSGYAYRVPKDWGRPAQNVPGFDPDSFAVDLRDGDRFTDNVNVLLSPVGKLTRQQAEEAAEAELSAVGAKNISVNDPVVVAGRESAHVTAVMSMNGTAYTIEQFYLSDGGRLYVVTFSFSRSLTAGERATVTETSLGTWVWTN